jgi:hypothetical protein
MMDQNNNNKRFLKCFFVGMVIVTSICLIYVSGTLAQWSPYSNAGWFSQPFFGSPFFSFNPISGYTGAFNNGFSTPYGNYPPQTAYSSSDLWSRGSSGSYPYNNIFSPYNSRFLTSGAFVSPAFSSFNSPGANSFPPPTFPLFPEPVYTGQQVQGWPYGEARYAGPVDNNPYFTGIAPSFIPNMPISLPWEFFGRPTGTLLIHFLGIYEKIFESRDPEPGYAPGGMGGGWQSQQLTDEDGNKIKGKLKYVLDDDLLKMSDSSLPLGEGELTEFEYTPTFGEAPISFNGVFDSGYTAYFSGTANNHLWDYFDIEGTYEIKDNEGQIADRGTFSFSF